MAKRAYSEQLRPKLATRITKPSGTVAIEVGQTLPAAFANPVAPLVVELRGARLEMERWIEAQENVWVFDLLRRPFRPVDLSSPTPLAALMPGPRLRGWGCPGIPET